MWQDFETRVRKTAELIWMKSCSPENIAGVNFDGVIRLKTNFIILIEMTENRSLNKVREDIAKLKTGMHYLMSKGVFARCICVVNGDITKSMKEAGGESFEVVSIDQFSSYFFDFEKYNLVRNRAPFGSAINPITGESDETDYVKVRYTAEGQRRDYSTADISDLIINGRRIVLLGEYGTGKSRCIKEVFRHLSDGAHGRGCYPLAVDLRNSWGLKRSSEIIRRHISDLGLNGEHESTAIRAFNSGTVAFLIDGFDEIGSQAWSNDFQKLRQIRAQSLLGVKDIVTNTKSGVLIAGREHYFGSIGEMYSALGLKDSSTIILKCKPEFSDTELLEYFEARDISIDVPEWLPRRPLICQTITDLADDQFEQFFGDSGNEVDFWNHFIRILCERDARINISFDADTILNIFIYLARLTRNRSANIGPISLVDLQKAFEFATGSMPVEEASVMLQRLPSLGRVSVESNDRQFVDMYILDGLRAKDVVRACRDLHSFSDVSNLGWINSLGDLGQRVLSRDDSVSEDTKMNFCRMAISRGNRVFASDIVASLLRGENGEIDFDGITIDQGIFSVLSIRDRTFKNIVIKNSYFGEFVLPAANGSKNIRIADCVTPKVIGVSSPSGLPYFVVGLIAESFDSVANVSRIRSLGLKPAHEVLATIIRKTFFQRGSGRKEEALFRGLGSPATRNLSRKIVAAMVNEGLLTTFRGDEGDVYAPVRSHTKRMQLILDELNGSIDPLWIKVGSI